MVLNHAASGACCAGCAWRCSARASPPGASATSWSPGFRDRKVQRASDASGRSLSAFPLFPPSLSKAPTAAFWWRPLRRRRRPHRLRPERSGGVRSTCGHAADGRAPAQRSVVHLDQGGRPGISHLLAVCPSPEAVPVRGSVKRNELDIRTALKHQTDQGKVAARNPQTGPRGTSRS
jgi:hypothetical protein